MLNICIFIEASEVYKTESDYDFGMYTNIPRNISIFFAIGCSLMCVNLLQVISVDPQWQLFVNIIYFIKGPIGKFLICALPIYLAFLAFGMCMFDNLEGTDRFDNLLNGLITLNSYMGGDEIADNLNSYAQVGFFGYLYGFSYGLFFLVVIQNVLVLLVTEGYEEARQEGKRMKNIAKKKTAGDQLKVLNTQQSGIHTSNLQHSSTPQPSIFNKMNTKQMDNHFGYTEGPFTDRDHKMSYDGKSDTKEFDDRNLNG